MIRSEAMTLKDKIRHVAERVRKWRESDTCCIELYVTLLKFQGLWQEQPSGGVSKWCARLMFGAALYLSLFTCLVGVYTLRKRSLGVLLEPIGFFFVNASIALLFGSFLYRGPPFYKLLRDFKNMRAQGLLLNLRCPDMRKETRALCDKSLSHYANKLGTVLLILPLVVPYLVRRRQLIFSGWYPFDEYASPAYEAVLTLLVVVIGFGLLTIALAQALAMALLIEARGQLQVLRANLSALSKGDMRRGVLALQRTSSFKAESLLPTPQHEAETTLRARTVGKNCAKIERLEQELRMCVIHHQMIIRFVRQFESAFSIMLIQNLSCCVIPTLLLGVLVAFSREIDEKFVMFFALTLFTMFDLAIFCELAERITIENDLVREAAFSCDWVESSDSFKSSLRIIMSATNKPFLVSIGGFVPLSNQQIFAVLNMTFSYYMSLLAAMEHAHQLFEE